MILKTLSRKLYNFYIFGNQLKENFAFNYKRIIIYLLFKIFFLIFSLYNEFNYI